MKWLCAVLLLFVASFALAEDAVFADDLSSIGFWGGPRVGLTVIDGQFGMLVGGRGLMTLNRHLSVGGAGWNLVTNVESKPQIEEYDNITLTYGGFLIEYIAGSERAAHVTTGLLLGGGSFSFRNQMFGSNDEWYDRTDQIFVVEPHLSLELNMTRFFRIDISGAYRFAIDVDFEPYEMKDISGPTMGVFFKFGYDFQESDWELLEELFEDEDDDFEDD